METTTKKTSLQAFIDAQTTGKIEISKPTAELMTAALTMQQNVYRISEILGAPYDNDVKDEINARILSKYEPFLDALTNEIAKYVSTISLSYLEFQGI